jgi:RPA family protein
MRVSATRVTVVGRVVRVRSRRDGGWRVRLADTGGALAVAEFRTTHLLPLPRRGTRIVIRGGISYNPDHGWYAVDPVDAWLEAGGT